MSALGLVSGGFSFIVLLTENSAMALEKVNIDHSWLHVLINL